MKELLEKLAAIEHERWSDWQRYVHSICFVDENGNYSIPKKAFIAWKCLIDTPYKDLSEKQKQLDRDEVKRYWHLINKEGS